MKATATEVKQRFGEYLDRAQREPVEIDRSGRLVAVLVSAEEYEALVRAEDYVWGRLAQAAAADGEWASPEEVAALVRRYEELEAEEPDADSGAGRQANVA